MRYDDRTLAGVLFFFGSTQFLLAMLIAEGSLPNYSVSSQVISDLGVLATAPLFNTSIILLGLLLLAAAYFYHRTHHGMWITVPFLLAAIGPIGVGLFTEDILVFHAIFALISFLFGSLAAIIGATLVRPPFRYVAAILGVVGLVALVLFLFGQDLGIGLGGMERMIAYPTLFWWIAFGGYLMSNPEPVPAQETPKGAVP